jgi:hypothetical protein
VRNAYFVLVLVALLLAPALEPAAPAKPPLICLPTVTSILAHARGWF